MADSYITTTKNKISQLQQQSDFYMQRTGQINSNLANQIIILQKNVSDYEKLTQNQGLTSAEAQYKINKSNTQVQTELAKQQTVRETGLSSTELENRAKEIKQQTGGISKPSNIIVHKPTTVRTEEIPAQQLPPQVSTTIFDAGKKRDYGFYVSDQRKNTATYGALIVSPQEAKKLQGSGRAYWELENDLSDFNKLNTEVQFSGSVPQTSGIFQSRGVYEYNRQGIIAGKEAYRQFNIISTDFKNDPASYSGYEGVKTVKTETGTSYELTPSFFQKNIDIENIYNNSLSKAKTDFSNLPSRTKKRLFFGGFSTGTLSTIAGVGEFAGTIAINMGVQTTKTGEFKTNRFYFSESNTLGRLRTTPTTRTTVKFLESPKTYAKQKITSPEFIGTGTIVGGLITIGGAGAYKNIKTYGWKTGSIETLSGFSPLRVKSGIYGQKLTADTKIKNVASTKYTNEAGVTTRIFKGSSGNIKISGVEQSAIINGQRVGAGYTITNTPTLNIRGGGSIITQGTRETFNPYTFGSRGSGTVSYNYPATKFNIKIPSVSGTTGGISSIKTARGFTIFSEAGRTEIFTGRGSYLITGGSYSKEVATGVNRFYSGRTGYYEPSGVYRLKPNVRGMEIDINKLFSGGTKGGFSTGSSGTITKTAVKTTGVKAVIPNAPTPIFKTSNTVLPPQITTTKTITPKAPSVSISQLAVKPKEEITTKAPTQTFNPPIVITGTKTKGSGISGTRSGGATIQLPKIDTKFNVKPVQDTVQTPTVIQVKKISTGQRTSTTGASTSQPAFSFNYNTPYVPVPTIPFIPPLIAGGGRGLKMGFASSRQSRTKYTPSFSALFFKIKGQAPKGTATGLRLRPIRIKKRRKNKLIMVRRVRI